MRNPNLTFLFLHKNACIISLLLFLNPLWGIIILKAENTLPSFKELKEKVIVHQYNNADSAKYYLDQIKENYRGNQLDTVYGEYLLLLGVNTSMTGSTSSALQYFEQSNHIFTSCKNNFGIAESFLNIGEIHYNWGEFNKAFSFFQKANVIAEKCNYSSLYIKSLNYIGKYYHSKGDLEQSLAFYKKALELAKQANDTIEIMSLYNKIGKDYKTLSNYAKALDCFMHAQRLVSYAANKVEQATTYNHLGNIYQVLKDYNKALLFHKKALHLREEVNYKEGIAKSLKNLGEVFVDLQQYDSALVCFDKSFVYCKEVGYAKGIVKNLYGKGLIYEKEGEYNFAIRNYKEALDYSHSIGYAIGESRVNLLLAMLYMNNANYGLAIKYCNDGLLIANKEDIKSNVSDFYLILSDVYTKKGKFEKALGFYKKHAEIKDEILNLETNKKIAELQTEYKLNLKSQENEVLKRENQIKELRIKRKNLFILFAIVITTLLIALVFILYVRFLNKKHANIELSRLNNSVILKNRELDKLNRKLRKSKDQQIKLFSIISHELRNPLYWFRNLIQMLASQIDNLDKEMISKSLFSLHESASNTFHLMDNLLFWSKSQLGNIKYKPEPVDITELIRENMKLLQQFASLKNIYLLFDNKEPVLVFADKEMIKTVIRNLLSNALKFTKENGEIQVLFKQKDHKVWICVKDNGIGMNKDVLNSILNTNNKISIAGLNKETGSGLGLTLCKEFIEKHEGALKVNSSDGKGSEFIFDLPLVS